MLRSFSSLCWSEIRLSSIHSFTKRDRTRVASNVWMVNGENLRSKLKTKQRNSDLSFKLVNTSEPTSFSPYTVLKLLTM